MMKDYMGQKEIWIAGLAGALVPVTGLLLSSKVPIVFGIIWIPFYPLSFLGFLLTFITDNSEIIFGLAFTLLVIEYIFIGLIIGFLLNRKWKKE